MAARPPIEKYGCRWPAGTDALKLEFACIVRGGQWTEPNGKVCGLGLFHHYREAQKLLWPEDDHHKWSDLMLKHILEQRVVVTFGPKDTSKTRTASKYALTDYFCFPNTTLVLITSTEQRGMELRVWGDTKSLFARAKENHDWLPGSVAESKHGIFTDQLGENCEVRDQRKGVICVPVQAGNGEWIGIEKWCFPAGEMVDTPTGQRKIEDIQTGDFVISAIGPSRVTSTANHLAPSLVRVRVSDGRAIDCTPHHRFLAGSGWKNAIDLKCGDALLSPNAALLEMSQGDPQNTTPVGQILLSEVQDRELHQDLSGVREEMDAIRHEIRILRQDLHDEVEMETATNASQGDIFNESVRGDTRQEYQCGTARKSGRTSTTPRANHQAPTALQSNSGHERRGGFCGLRRTLSVQARKDADGSVSRGAVKPQNSDWKSVETGRDTSLLDRFGVAGYSAGSGGGRVSPSLSGSTAKGQNQRRFSEEAKVVSVEVLKPGSDPRYSKSAKAYPVFNLQVEGHPSYSVNGVLVHNCGIKQDRRRLIADEFQFCKAPYLNSMEHLDKGDYKFLGLANPIGQGDPADKVGEPVGGWGSETESEKTEVWRNRWGGITINFDGRDTPNNDEPKNRYTYLISQKDIDRTANRRGVDSSPYWTQVIGKRKVGLDSKRVLTRMICLSFGAFEPVIWSGSATTKVFAIDASYGGDRCMAGWIEFGMDVKNQTIISFTTPYEIPILMSVKEIPEDQIAARVKRDCEAEGIPPGNVFFDSTGRGSLGTSFGRLWSPEVNPVEFGGNPTARPVAQGMFVYDEKLRGKRLERCDEHYSKRVTEYWFSVRYVVEARQARNFPEICAEEFGMREWYRVAGNKIELEKKEETKERLGCSPDAADWAAIAVEGARRLGFTIDGLVDEASEKEDDDWLKRELQKHNARMRKRELSYR